MIALELASGLLLLTGAAFYLAGTVGLLRFADVYTRLYALTRRTIWDWAASQWG